MPTREPGRQGRLKRADPSAPGIARRRVGRGFGYVDADGRRVTDADVLDRIRALVLPPAWTDVWICADPNGHIQAVGTDAAGRRQYRYHDVWRARRDLAKFDRVVGFARALPDLRAQVSEHLGRADLDQERVLACAARLLDLGFFRIGGEGYASANQTFGLATMRKSHVTLSGEVVRFDYVAKSGKRRVQSLADPDVIAVLTALKRRRGGGPELLAYRRGSTWVDVRSADINGYLKDVTGGQYTAKDFRTWSATVLAAVALAVSEEVTAPVARRRAVTRAVCEVAHYLGNTPTVCRTSYIDPRVVDRYLAGVTVKGALDRLGADTPFGSLSTQGPVEAAVLDLLDGAPGTAAAPAPLRRAG
ncbi:MAG TPA: DNA topoisomerase IB [Mycobacteriales bacterium]|nr:DNA topoisomerase IB [Mycobacteriales bacterium]